MMEKPNIFHVDNFSWKFDWMKNIWVYQLEAWSYKEKNHKELKHTGNPFRKNLQLKGIC